MIISRYLYSYITLAYKPKQNIIVNLLFSEYNILTDNFVLKHSLLY